VKTALLIVATALMLGACSQSDRMTRGATTGSVIGGASERSAGGAIAAERAAPLCWYSRYHERTVCRR
jgi:hypothetical protein